MITAELEAKPAVDDLDGIDGVSEYESEDDYEYVYPPELLETWVKGFEDMKLKVARGELKSRTVEEMAAACGVTLD